MSGEYRDELGAAHARIEELEQKVRVLEEDANPATRPRDGKFPELEAEVARLRKEADPQANARRRTQLSVVGAAFPLLGMVFTFLKLPLVAASCSVVFVGLVIAGIVLATRLTTKSRELKEAESKLSDARRIAELESKLAKVRVASPDDSVVDEVEGGAEAGVRRRA